MMWQLLLNAALVIGAPEFTVQTVDGQSAEGVLAQLDAQELVLEGPGGPVKFALGSLAVVTRNAPTQSGEAKPAVAVELLDQSIVMGMEYTVSGSTAHITQAGGAKLNVPTRIIRSVRFGAVDQYDSKLTKQWTEIVESKAAGDLLAVRKNGALDYLEGVLGNIDTDTCKFELDKESIPVKRPKIEGLVYFHPNLPELPEATGRLSLADGGAWSLRSTQLADGKLKIKTPIGIELDVELDSVTRFDFSTGKVAYLSDLEPESVSFTPYIGFSDDASSLSEVYQYRRDTGFEQSPLKLDGKTYRKGLALQSRTALVYKLPGKFRLFRAVVGIDDLTRDTGDVHVEIKGDGKMLWQGEVTGSQPARELELELASVKRLEILADYGGGLDIGDRLNLCEARVTK